MLIVLLAMIVFAGYLSILYFERHCLDNFHAELILDQPRSMIEEEFDLILTLSNRKLMILPLIKIHLFLPAAVKLKEVEDHRSTVTFTASLLFHQQLRQRISMFAKERGIHEIKAEIVLSDFTGFAKHTLTLKPISLIIHPAVKQMDTLLDISNSTEGDALVQRWLHPDPIFFTGHRPYTYRDPMKEIDWKASARLQELYVKQHDTTADFEAVLCILIETNENLYMDHRDFLEAAIDFASALLYHSAKAHLPIGLISNAAMKTDFGSVFRPDCGDNHIIRCYDTLACLTPYQRTSSFRTLQSIAEFLNNSQQCCILANRMSDTIYNAIEAYLNKGIKPVLILYQKEDVQLPASVELYWLKAGEYHE